MKHGRRPTKAQKILLQQAQLDPAQWLVVKNTSDELLVSSPSARIDLLALMMAGRIERW